MQSQYPKPYNNIVRGAYAIENVGEDILCNFVMKMSNSLEITFHCAIHNC